jgi:hypothetical protein
MKKLVLGLIAVAMAAYGLPAFATSPVTIDFTTYYNDPIAALFDYTEAADEDDNLIPDGAELMLLENCLANTTAAGHDLVHAAWVNNSGLLLTNLMPNLPATLPPVSAVPVPLRGQPSTWANVANIGTTTYSAPNGGTAMATLAAGLATIGDAEKVDDFEDVLTANEVVAIFRMIYVNLLGMTTDQFNTFYTNWVATTMAAVQPAGLPFLGTNGDSDGDDYDNLTEWNASADAADYVTRATREDAPPAFSVTIAKNAPNAVKSGTVVTFTATPANGTAPYQYQWKKNGVDISGADDATLVLTTVVADSGTYTCSVIDAASPEAKLSNAVTIQVLDSAALPAMGIAGIALLAGLAGALGARKIRK